MDAVHEVPDLDPRRDTVACAALLLAMVISAICAAFVIDFDVEAGAAPIKYQTVTPARCVSRGVSIL
jgi:hypothetical protein